MQIQSAWYVEKPEIEPVRFGEWVGKVSSGMSSTNFNNILLIPMDTGHGMSGSYHKWFYSVNHSEKIFYCWIGFDRIGRPGRELLPKKPLKVL
jgi:hypothetical protein